MNANSQFNDIVFENNFIIIRCQTLPKPAQIYICEKKTNICSVVDYPWIANMASIIDIATQKGFRFQPHQLNTRTRRKNKKLFFGRENSGEWAFVFDATFLRGKHLIFCQELLDVFLKNRFHPEQETKDGTKGIKLPITEALHFFQSSPHSPV